MKTYIRPYKLGSATAKDIAKTLGLLRVSTEKVFRRPSIIINWGNGKPISATEKVIVLNRPESVSLCSNKIRTFEMLKSKNVSIPKYTTDSNEAMSWINDKDFVYGRKRVDSSQGDGIIILTQDEPWQNCPLYTQAIQKAYEYRVHIFKDRVFDFAKKRKKLEGEANPFIKNHSNGWVFCREGEVLPDLVKKECIKAIQALGLDFGALDVLYREKENKAWILEVNTAPGLEGTTLDKYIRIFREYCL